MADLYSARVAPEEYSSRFFSEELRRIEATFAYYETPAIRISPTNVAPLRAFEGDVYNADGTNWNPGGGAGLYQYVGGAWTKL